MQCDMTWGIGVDINSVTYEVLNDKYCDVCGRPMGAGWTVTVMGHPGIVLHVCKGHCEEEIPMDLRKQSMVEFIRGRSHAENEKMTEQVKRGFGVGKDLFLEDMSMREPEFFKCLIEFRAGNYTLDDGTEDKFMVHVSQSVDRGIEIKEWQCTNLRKRCEYYIGLMRRGEPVTSYDMGGPDVDDLVGIVTRYLMNGELDAEYLEPAKSILASLKKKGTITAPQFQYLKRMESSVSRRI